ncbi:MAG: T9SS type A sorting domain-containing protein [Saprospiraceae bacterium]|nr:T9SS type A sorting domain-containing protein [Saprospiraceae bacterium]
MIGYCHTGFRWVILLFILSGVSADAQQTITGSIQHKGLNRSYRLRLPAGHNTQQSIPLVFNLHGFTSNATQQELYSGMNAVADTARFAVCYPNGVATSWNVGWTFGSTADDVGFISALIDDLVSKYNFDTRRIYACGMSNGGFMSFRLACELSNKIAAVASVTGSVAPGRLMSCNPGRPVPVMAVHGTADDVVLYNGSAINLPIEQVVRFWVEHNQCSEEYDFFAFPDINTTDNSTAESYSYTDCDEDAEVLFIKINGGGHTWPGTVVNNGVVNRDINASLEIWKFFRKFRLQDVSDVADMQEAGHLIRAFPNPATDFITLTGVPERTGIRIWDSYGRLILQGDTETDLHEKTLNLSHWKAGIYYLQIENNQFSKTIKLIKI